MLKSRSGISIETPSAADFAGARRRTQLAAEAFCPATITIDGTERRGAAASSGRTWEVTEGGRREIERVRFLIDKKILTTEPALGESWIWQERTFKVTGVSGRSPVEESWMVTALWMPGDRG
jgi:hypothetical protein